jgi:hypothetical protein
MLNIRVTFVSRVISARQGLSNNYLARSGFLREFLDEFLDTSLLAAFPLYTTITHNIRRW